jgi:AraC-like DNA-binding protein
MSDHQGSGKEFAVVEWLLEVTDSRQPLTESSPIWVRSAKVTEGLPSPHPERHPFCEINLILQSGAGYSMLIERETIQRGAGELLLLGPGIPYWSRIETYPLSWIAIYFLPSVLIEMGPESDGMRVLRRFTAQQSADQRVVRLPPKLRAEFRQRFEEIDQEFAQPGFGREMRLRTLLIEMLVKLVRWEQTLGRNIGGEELEVDRALIVKTLKYIREHFNEPIYAHDLARAAGLSELRLKTLFQEAVGISWVKYLQGYRIHRAAALIGNGRHNVTEAALAVGFESLSHFNKTFHSFMGVSPKKYGESG